MTVLLASAQRSPTEGDDAFTDVIVHINARVVSAARVRRKVNGWLTMEAGDRLLAGEPELMLGERLIWRVPIRWTSPTQGVLARMELAILVDAASGDFAPGSPTSQEIEDHVATLARSLRSAA
ncbi:MAG: hypothetical protein M9936_32410 [Caldilinea sp.]|nr:hypothetical protein [Caldilinea sp.]MCB0069274.1 hypothetical protein [Caldilineaceae bacterium]MCO5214429.1 hypothetical protein [Caldilinea sp.]